MRFPAHVLAALVLSALGGLKLRAQSVRTDHVVALGARDLEGIVRQQADSGFRGDVVVAEDDSVMFRRSIGARRKDDGTTRPFWIASVTKSFTAAAVLALQDEGRLSVHDSLGRFFTDVPADKRAITVHQLLTHTAGFGTTYTGAGHVRRDDAVAAILAKSLAYRPGDGYRYVDDDYELLAAIVEVASGESWEVVIQRRVLDRHALRDTGFGCAMPPGGRPLAAPPEGAPSICASQGDRDWAHRGANGMWASADDLVRWGSIVRDAPDGARWRPIVKPHVRVRAEGGREVWYGYGVRIYTKGDTVVEIMYSGSGDDGHTVMVRQLRCGVTVAVVSNAGAREGTTWASVVAARVVAAIAAEGRCREDE